MQPCENCGWEMQNVGTCPICGYFNLVRIGSGSEKGRSQSINQFRQSEEFKMNILSRLDAFSIQADSFRLNSSQTGFARLEKEDMFNESLTGLDLYKKKVWSEMWIANPKALDIVGKEQTVPFSYKVNGQERKGEFKITPGDTEGVVCSLGMSIDENLRLHLYLGNDEVEKGHAEVDIKWRKDG